MADVGMAGAAATESMLLSSFRGVGILPTRSRCLRLNFACGRHPPPSLYLPRLLPPPPSNASPQLFPLPALATYVQRRSSAALSLSLCVCVILWTNQPWRLMQKPRTHTRHNGDWCGLLWLVRRQAPLAAIKLGP